MRAVYYDPFGQRTEGYRRGVEDEVTLQDQTRRARASDFDFDYYNPLRLAQAQRMDTYGKAALPYQIADLGIDQRANLANLYALESLNRQEIGRATGEWAPYLAGAQVYGSGQSLGSEKYFPAMVRNVSDMFDANAGIGPENYGTPEYMTALESAFGLPTGSLGQYQSTLSGHIGPDAERGADQYFGREDMRNTMLDQLRLQELAFDQQAKRIQLQQAEDKNRGLLDYYRLGAGYGRTAAPDYSGYSVTPGTIPGINGPITGTAPAAGQDEYGGYLP